MPTSDLRQLRDEDLRPALFDALVARLDARVQDDASLTVVNRMPTVFAVSRRGTLLTLSQGLGRSLLRGDLKWKNRLEKPRCFNVMPTTLSKLAIMPDRIEGTPDEIVDRIVTMFLDWTATGEDVQPAAGEERPRAHPPAIAGSGPEAPIGGAPGTRGKPPVVASPPAAKSTGASPAETLPAPTEGAATSARSTDERDRPRLEGRGQPASRPADEPNRAAVVPPRLEERQEPTTPALRTYELLLDTALRELDQAKELPVSSNYRLLSAGVFVALSAEAFLNDLGARVIPSWSALHRLDAREKAEVLALELFNDKVAWNGRPFQSVAEAFDFRRALAHAHSETLPFGRSGSADRPESEAQRTRETDWFRRCNVATIQRWVADLRFVIARFSKAHDPA